MSVRRLWMSEPWDAEPPTWDEEPSEPTEEEREIAAAHDPLGLDLASQIARGTMSMLPPPRGVRAKPKRRRRPVDPDVRSGSGPDARDPQLLGAALDHLMRDRGWAKEVSLRLLLDRWPALVGPTNAAHSHPEAYADTVLTIRTDATVWSTSLRTLAPSLVAKLNKELGEGTVTRIQVLGPNAPSWNHGPRSVRDGRGPRDTYG